MEAGTLVLVHAVTVIDPERHHGALRSISRLVQHEATVVDVSLQRVHRVKGYGCSR